MVNFWLFDSKDHFPYARHVQGIERSTWTLFVIIIISISIISWWCRNDQEFFYFNIMFHQEPPVSSIDDIIIYLTTWWNLYRFCSCFSSPWRKLGLKIRLPKSSKVYLTTLDWEDTILRKSPLFSHALC